jgi:hypothetical protein
MTKLRGRRTPSNHLRAEQASAAQLLLAPVGPAFPGQDPRDVVIGVSPAVGRDVWRSLSGLTVPQVLGELLAGLEEEGCTGRVVRFNDTVDLGRIGLAAARLAGSGIGIGAAADLVKRGPCVRLDASQRFEAENGSRGFLDGPADPAAAGMLAAAGPTGWLPFDRRHSPAEWRAIRLRLKEAVFAAILARVLRTLGRELGQVLIVGGPAGDDELLGVLLRTLPEGVTAGRGNVGGTLAGIAAGHRHAAALGLALAPPEPAVP